MIQTLSGILQVGADGGFFLIVDGPAANMVEITDPTFYDRIVAVVPPWVGGRLYNDPCTLTGDVGQSGRMERVIEGVVVKRDNGGTYPF